MDLEELTHLAPIFQQNGAGNIYIIILIIVTAYNFLGDVILKIKGESPKQNAEKVREMQIKISKMELELQHMRAAAESARQCLHRKQCPVLQYLNDYQEKEVCHA